MAALLCASWPLTTLAAPPPASPPPPYKQESAAAGGQVQQWLNSILSPEMQEMGLRLLLGLLLFIAGWLIAKFVSWLVFRLLCKTDLDNKLANKLGITMLLEETGGKRQSEALERGVATVVFWLLMMLVVVGVLEYAGLEQAAGPIQRLVDTVIQALPLLGKAVLILVVAYIAAMILRLVVRKAIDIARIDARFAELDREPLAEGEEPKTEAEKSLVNKPFSESAGQVVFWLVMVFGLAGALDALAIEALSGPLSNAIDSLMALLPAIGIAALIGVGGYVLAKIVRTIVSNLLESLGFDRLVARLKLSGLFGNSTPSKVAGWLVMAFVLMQTAIAALHRLGLETLSGPLTGMMERFWAVLPALVVSVLFVVVGVFVGRLLRGIVRGALESVGFDRLMDKIGFGKIATREDELGKPSGLVGFVVQIVVILLAVVQGLNNMALTTWAGYVDAFLQFAVTRAAVALVIVAVAFAVGNYVRDLIHARTAPLESDTEIPRPVWLAEFARSAVLVFGFTAAIHQLGVAEDFVLLSFALLFGGLCLAAALAFGLGSREVAGEIVRERWNKAKKAPTPGGKPPMPSSPSPSSSGIFGKPSGQ
ncbi:mechanosensitive ion channel [Nannocystaceae bacterium ST9]